MKPGTALNILVMKIISTKTHAVLDYVITLILFLSPQLFKLMDLVGLVTASVWMVPSLVGVVQFSISVVTRYEGGIFKKIPMRIHLNLDRVLGLFLGLSPWLFGFSSIVYLPHLAIGGFLFLMSLVTSKEPRPKQERKREPFLYERPERILKNDREQGTPRL